MSDMMLKEFEEHVKEIYRYACRYGIEKSILEPTSGYFNNQSFLRTCHAGFAKAQELIIQELFLIAEKRRELEAKIKQANKNGDETTTKSLKGLLKIENYKESVIRKLADSIAWQLIVCRNDIARRLCTVDTTPSIDQSNFMSVKDVVENLNAKDPLSFALISDLTSFVKIGDIIARDKGMLKITEVKEGAKNLEALNIFEHHFTRDELIDFEKLTSTYDANLAKQVMRIQRQHIKAQQASELINKGEGIDPATGIATKIHDDLYSLIDYMSELQALLGELDQRIMAYTEIENCLMIGAYRDLAKNDGKKIIQCLVNQFTGKKFPVFSFAQSLYIPVCEPIFLKTLREQDIFDIIFDRTRVYMAIKLDNFIKMFDANGAKTRWLSRKETDKIRNESHLSKDILVYDNKAIAVELGGFSMYLGNGVLGRIMFDNILPSSVVSMNFHSLQEAIGDERQNQPVNSS